MFAATKNEHDFRLKNVLNRLQEYGVLLNKDKCIYGAEAINFLGHRLSAQGIKPAHDKVLAIRQFREPRTAEEVRSFLGLVNYVGKFIPNLATTSEPLRQLIKKEEPFNWVDVHRKAFEELKGYLTDESTLGSYNDNDRTMVIADASPVGLGCVLIQFNEKGPRVITYANRSLSSVEKRYAQTEKEALALVCAVERFHYYLYGRDTFELVTDHKALEIIFNPKSKPCARIERWVLRLQSYRFNVVYKPGKSNIADPLSRLIPESVLKTEPRRTGDEYIQWLLSYAEPKAIKLTEIERNSSESDEIKAVRQAKYNAVWNEITKPFKVFENELCFSGNILLHGTRIVMPENLRERVSACTRGTSRNGCDETAAKK